MSKPDYIVLSLPRSRSAWMSAFLSYPPFGCGHDLAIESGSIEEFLSHFEIGYRGTVETGAVVAWRAIRKACPDTRIVVVKRDVEEVMASFERIGIAFDGLEAQMRERASMLDELSAQPGVTTIGFWELSGIEACVKLFTTCLDLPFDMAWWRWLAGQNIQVDAHAKLLRAWINREQIENLKKEAAALATDVTIGLETFGSVWPEADALARKHFSEVDGGIEPNRPYEVDVALMKMIEAAGALKIVTARVDGKLVGYCTWNISPDVESKGLLIAQQGAWYIDDAHEGLGIKMFRASISELRKLGVQNIFPHHRLQGRGVRLGKLFERLGAKEIQHTYSLWIGDKPCLQ